MLIVHRGNADFRNLMYLAAGDAFWFERELYVKTDQESESDPAEWQCVKLASGAVVTLALSLLVTPAGATVIVPAP